MLSYTVIEDAKHMNAQARVCTCQLRLYLFPGCETLPQVIQRNGIEWWPYAQAILVPSVPKPPAAYGKSSSPMILPPIRPARLRRPRCLAR